MGTDEPNVVTGAFGYSGRHITRRLLAAGQRVKTLTGHPDRPNPFGDQVEAAPFSFDDPGALIESLRGATTLYNTYWIRFPMHRMTHEKAVENTKTLIRAAEEAGLKRIVHISVVKPSADSPYSYYRGKAAVEEAIRSSALSYAILRPTVFFGGEDILLNNLAWSLRRFPVFPVPGRGDCRIQPISVEDFAEIAVQQGQSTENVVWDVVGPETYTFRELVKFIGDAVGVKTWVLGVPKPLMLLAAKGMGLLVRDVMLTRDEINGLLDGLMASDETPRGTTKLSQWLHVNRELVGKVYASEMRRR